MAGYEVKAIEAKWQAYWREHPIVRRSPVEAPKYYLLHMMPQPSPRGFHLGHAYGFVAVDTVARFKQMSGYAVLHPVGWDAFCNEISKEARSNNRDPQDIVAESVPRCRQELEGLGISCDWDREVISSHPKIVAGSRWIFELLHNSWFDPISARARPIEDLPIPEEVALEGAGAVEDFRARYRLVVPEQISVWWSEATGIVADSEAGDTDQPLERRTALAWRVRITAYADRLIDDLEHVHWPRSIRDQQKQWIGRRTGYEVSCQVSGSEGKILGELAVFIERPELLFGVTMLFMSANHPLLQDIKRKPKPIPGPYVLPQVWAMSPIGQMKVPVVVMPNRTDGLEPQAWFGVPAHDERAFEVARTYQLPIRPVFAPKSEPGDPLSLELRIAVIEAEVPFVGTGEMLPQDSAEFRELGLGALSPEEAGKRIGEWLIKTAAAKKSVRYRLNDWSFSRAAGWGEEIPINLPIQKEEPVPPILRLATMPRWMAASWYCLAALLEDSPENQHSRPWSVALEEIWTPVDLFVSGSEHAGQYLLYARFMHKVLFDRSFVSTAEPFLNVRLNGKILGVEYRDRNSVAVTKVMVEELPGGAARHRDTGARLERYTRAMARDSGNTIWVGAALAEFGSDALRLSLLVSVTGEASRIWEPSTVAGIQRFMRRVWKLIVGDQEVGIDARYHGVTDDAVGRRALARLVLKVTTELEANRPHVAFSSLRDMFQEIFSHSLGNRSVARFVRLLAPFAPHLAEELWSRMGNVGSVHQVPWPKIDPDLLGTAEVQLIVQRNGRTVGVLPMSAEVSRNEIPGLVEDYFRSLEQTIEADEALLVVEKKKGRAWIVNAVKTLRKTQVTTTEI